MSYLRKSPRQRRASATFEAIVEAAAHILRKGEALTTNAVATRAGASIGSLYQYFPNKQAIVRALVERELKRAEVKRPKALDASDDVATVVRAAVDWHFDLRGDDPALARNLAALAAEVLPEEERQAVAKLRRERVGRTVGRILCARDAARRTHATFVFDVCLNAMADEAMRRRPAWLKSDAFRAEAARVLLNYVSAK